MSKQTPKAPNVLFEEYPQHADRIRALVRDDPDFRARAEEYHRLSRGAHRLGDSGEPTEENLDVEHEKARNLMRDELMRAIMR